MAELIEFKASDDDQQAVCSILRDALEAAERGEVIDVALATVSRAAGQEPEIGYSYWGNSSYAALVGAINGLLFDMQMTCFAADDEE